MPRVKPSVSLLGLYIPVLLLGLLLPRNIANDIDATPKGIITRLLHEILYLTGPTEIFLNFLLFIPFFFALLFLNLASSRYWAALISCATSAASELGQSQIPGRVSSLRDFFSNCVGVVLALVIATELSKGKSSKEI